MLSLRNATEADLGEIRRIYEYAQDYMIRSGNPTQWGHFYPSADLIRSDLQKKVCKVIYDETGIHGVFALFEGAEPTYAHIEEGEWLNDEPYVTIHRQRGPHGHRGGSAVGKTGRLRVECVQLPCCGLLARAGT